MNLNAVKKTINEASYINIALTKEQPVLSFIMPWFRAKALGWLPLEALCRQENIDFDWELIIMEEKIENPFGLNIWTF